MKFSFFKTAACLLAILLVSGCATYPEAPSSIGKNGKSIEYLIGPGDRIQIFVWRNSDLTVEIPVRPDGKINTPLIEDLVAAGKTPSALAREVEKLLKKYIRNPQVTVIVKMFAGDYGQLVRVIGEAGNPMAIPYRSGMTVLDVMIQVGGLTVNASGNKASIIRNEKGMSKQYRVRLDDLIKDGDISANVPVMPGDTLIIPEAWF
ncbi:MAG: sugar ABC transporter substrate-binding protein [Gammaproteobacteria bacterium]|mgnify:CR=1 FL=1|nr:MAG: sugar ABC transporter substrate-binding protein [Gammaproteobacteria bacterium]